ncbi:MAG: hypothetical protein ACYC7E_16535 [Armatimonadota bacterium]
MGSFYDNIHLRTQNRPFIEQAWQNYWEERQESSRAWISPDYGGWISVFDWRCDQQDTDVLGDLAAHLSRAADCVTLAFQVYDSDLAEYWLFNHGIEVDHYTSNSEYFPAFAQAPEVTPEEGIYSGYGPDSKPGYPVNEDFSDGGNTGLLKSLTGTQASDVELEAILRTPATISDDILTALASAIGINDSWAAVGYHYLATENDTILGFDSFRHLPEGVPPHAERFFEHE